MESDGNEQSGREEVKRGADGAGRVAEFRRLAGGAQGPPSGTVQLVREWKGPTVAALQRDRGAVAGLPGKRRRAPRAAQQPGNDESTDRRLQGRVLAGPGCTQRRSWHWHFWLAAVLGGSAIALSLFGG